jgi:hypothetical protein
MPTDRLDSWLPDPGVRTLHRRSAAATPEELWSAARELRISEAGKLGRLVRWRIPGTPEQLTFDEMFRRYPFTLLEEGEGHLISGLCGRIWTLQRDYPRIGSAEEFAEWDQAGTVRVAFAHWVQPDGDGRTEILSEARVRATDRVAAVRLRALWAVIGPFERLVGAEPLSLAVRRAEAAGGHAPGPRASSPRRGAGAGRRGR